MVKLSKSLDGRPRVKMVIPGSAPAVARLAQEIGGVRLPKAMTGRVVSREGGAARPYVGGDFPTWLRETYPKLTWNWPWQEYVYPSLQAIGDGDLLNLMLILPPRHGKTFLSTRFVTWFLLRYPHYYTIMCGYNADRANKYSRDIRRLVGEFIEFEGQLAVTEWDMPGGGGLIARGMQGGVTGYGANLLVIDDPIKNQQEANSLVVRDLAYNGYVSDLSSRIEPGGRRIIISTRWHDDDLIGRILNSPDADQWTVIRLPALAEDDDPLGRELGEALCPSRYSVKKLLAFQRINPLNFSALYQGNPVPLEGGLIKREYLRHYALGAVRIDDPWEQLLWMWDTAGSGTRGDYTVGQLWGRVGIDCFLLDQRRGQWETPETIEQIAQAMRDVPRAQVYIEKTGGGKTLYDMFNNLFPNIQPYSDFGDKESRVRAVTPYMANGHVLLPPMAVGYVPDLVDELLHFPMGKYDDQVDTLSSGVWTIMQGAMQRALEYPVVPVIRSLEDLQKIRDRDLHRYVDAVVAGKPENPWNAGW